MRILLRLEATKDFEYDLKYYHKLQGFVYGLLKDTEYKILHDKRGYKFFCFSNIFPVSENIKAGEEKNLIISSPSKIFVNFLGEKIKKIYEEKIDINIGEMSFKIKRISMFETKLKRKNVRIVSATPIIIRIPERNYDKYGIIERKKRYVYWRPEYSFEAFIKQLEENLFKKYKEFYNEEIEEFPIFEQFKFKKSLVSHVIINGKEIKMIGSIWEFGFSYLDDKKKKLLEFGIDCGFGERNSLGFGFVNVVRNKLNL